VERIMAEEGLSPLEATRKAMDQITGALIGISLVLTAVFIPMAFFSGSVGTIYRQFSLSLVSSMLFSVFLAMSLTPALCATLLKPIPKGHKHEKRGFFGWFNRAFAKNSRRYQTSVGGILKHTWISMAVFVVIIFLVGLFYVRLPSSFLPAEDQGYFITNIQLPVGAAQARTDEVLRQVEEYFLKQPEIQSFITVAGFSFNGRGQNSALSFGRLKDWKEREGAEHTVQSVIARAGQKFAAVKDAIIFPLNPPAINELGNSTGFDMQLQDLAGLGHAKLLAARNQLLAMAAKNPTIVGVRVQGLEDAAQLKLDVDEGKAATFGVAPADINSALQTSFGSAYINNFINGNRVQRVIVQLDAPYRMAPEDVKKIYVRSRAGAMVPLSAFTTVRWIYGSPQLQNYNGFPSYEIIGAPAAGKSTGEAMDAMEKMVRELPAGIGFEWTGQSYEERLSGSQAPMLYALSLLVVFLCLAALYESWSIPLSVILVVPLGILGALLASTLRGLPNDVYFKVGLLTTVGLATKNAILIIEYAKDLQAEGRDLIEATLEAVHLRLRPILMTSFAFILGVMPLVLSAGAGSASRNAIGTGVAGGMFAATALGIFLIPVLYVVVRRIFKPRRHTTTDLQPSTEGNV
jgi:hydrophobe/amphiphile efflux-1 (HAE1) family protein